MSDFKKSIALSGLKGCLKHETAELLCKELGLMLLDIGELLSYERQADPSQTAYGLCRRAAEYENALIILPEKHLSARSLKELEKGAYLFHLVTAPQTYSRRNSGDTALCENLDARLEKAEKVISCVSHSKINAPSTQTAEAGIIALLRALAKQR